MLMSLIANIKYSRFERLESGLISTYFELSGSMSSLDTLPPKGKQRVARARRPLILKEPDKITGTTKSIRGY